MDDPDYEIDFEARNTFLHVTVRSSNAPAITRSRSWTPSTSSNHSSEHSVPSGWLPASPRRDGALLQTATHRVYNLTSVTSTSSKASSQTPVGTQPSQRSDRVQQEDEDEEPYEFPSSGSIGHWEGKCQPCRFIHLADGCRNGRSCNYCHEEHETGGTKTHRPSKGVRSGYKRAVNQIVEADMPEEEKMEAYQRLAERSPYMRCLLKAVVPNIDEIMKARADGGAKVVVPPAMPRVPGLQPKVEASPTKLSL